MEAVEIGSGYKVHLPNGPSVLYSLRPGQTWKDVVTEHVIPSWEEYCNKNWLSENHEQTYCGENKVKAFLNQCAYLLTLDNPVGLESAYLNNRHTTMEIPVSNAPSEVDDFYYSASKPPMPKNTEEWNSYDMMVGKLDERALYKNKAVKRKRKETRFDKIQTILRNHPNSKATTVLVDTDGRFEYDGVIYKIPAEEKAYSGEWQSDGEKYYAMDQVMVVENDEGLTFYDANLNRLVHEIKRVG